MKKVGVLALQGDFAAHEKAFQRAGASTLLVREPNQLETIDGLVIPGGESTTMLKLLRYSDMIEPLRKFSREKPIFGTCAGAILLAKEVSNPSQECLEAMDISIERNAYGRQNESSIVHIEAEPEFYSRTGTSKLEAVFIRAPVIRKVGPKATVLASYKGDPILVEQGLHLAATFHPELTTDSCVQKLFLSKL
jgi:5'-phosphate synthase pdxT subunit